MQVIRPEHNELLKAHAVFRASGYVVERGDKDVHSSMVEVRVRLWKGSEPSPWFYGQAAVLDKNIIHAVVCAELVALTFAARAYHIPFTQDHTEELPVAQEDVSSEGLTKRAIVHSMGATVHDVEIAMYGMGVDMSAYVAYKDKLNRQGKRITKEKMADFFFPDGGKPKVVYIKVGDPVAPASTPSFPPPPVVKRSFTAEF